MNKINALSLFSSAGIGELNLHQGQLNFIAANELLEKRANCYSYFFPETKMFQGSITDDNLQNKMISYAIDNDVKFLLATPPCQGFSSVGKNKAQQAYLEDRRNFLIMEVFNFIDKIDLNAILIENVPRFMKMYFPYKGSFQQLDYILNDRYGEKFNIDIRILNAKDYGISQSRPRVIIKLVKKNFEWEWPALQKEIPLKDVIGDLPSLEAGESSGIKWHAAKGARPQIIEAMRHTPTGHSAIKNEIYYPKKKDGTRISGFHNTYKRMSWDRPAPARTTYSGSISSHNNVHPGHLKSDGTYSDARVLTLLETFLVSSISPKIIFPPNLSDTFIRTIIGESIPPKLLEQICYPHGDGILGIEREA